MAHDISGAAFSNEGAWHGLGTVVPRNMEPEEGFKLAGLDWELVPTPMYLGESQSMLVSEPDGTLRNCEKTVLGRRVPNRAALVRSDTGAILGTGSEAYTPFQNRELLQLAKEIQEIDGSAYLESALELGGGSDVVLLLRMREWSILGDDQVSYITLWNNHTGALPLHAYGTDVRVVCRNTLMWSAGSAKGKVKIRHTSGIHAGSKDLVRACKAAREASGSWEDVARTFAGAQVSDYYRARTMLIDAYKGMMPEPEFKAGDSKHEHAKRHSRWQTGLDNYLQGTGRILRSRTCSTDATRGTAFGLFNAITEWIDNDSPRVRDRQEAKITLDSATNVRKRELVNSFGMSLQLSSI